MIALKIKNSGEYIGSLSEAQLQYLIDELVEEHGEDQDYWLNRAQVEIFKEKGADPSLIALLESALGDGDEVEVKWEKS
jgi:hypothetical protein